MKNYILIGIMSFMTLTSCDQATMQRALEVANSALQVSEGDIAGGLKEALNFGVDKAVTTLSAQNGYYNSPYKILLPQEAQNVVDKLKIIPGFDNVEQSLIKKINQGAEDAAKKAGPIFLDAIKGMTINDAMSILMGEKNAATNYLHKSTYNKLYAEFQPVLVNSLNKFGALDLWTDAVNKYNSIPLVNDVNPDLADHINTKALVGLFDLVEKKELGIRTNISERKTDLLKNVFAKQD